MKLHFPPWNGRSAKEPPTADMTAALGDAAWMTAMERNSDLVKMQCYAPLFVNVNPGARQWRPDFIGYDALHCLRLAELLCLQDVQPERRRRNSQSLAG